MLDSLSSSLRTIVKKIRGSSLFDAEQIKELVEDLETALIESDVNVDLVLQLTETVRTRALEDKLSAAVSRTDYVIKVIHDELINLLGARHYSWTPKATEVNTMMFIGIQGSGKTTTIAKAALYWKRRGMTPGVICADSFRPGAYVQLTQLLEP